MSTQDSALSQNDYIGYKLTTVIYIFMVLEAVFVALRFLARHFAKTPWGLDDTLIIPSLLFCWGVCIHALGMLNHGKVRGDV